MPDAVHPGRGRKARRGAYNTSPGDDEQRRATKIPDLNAEFVTDEVPLSQNAPPADEIQLFSLKSDLLCCLVVFSAIISLLPVNC